MILTIDTAGKDFQVTKAPSEKLDQHGTQRIDKQTGEPVWCTQVVVTDDDGGEIITISTAGGRPEVETGDLVEPQALVAIPWNTNGRAGIAYRAQSIKLLDDNS